jgi:hypothetical protein
MFFFIILNNSNSNSCKFEAKLTLEELDPINHPLDQLTSWTLPWFTVFFLCTQRSQEQWSFEELTVLTYSLVGGARQNCS